MPGYSPFPLEPMLPLLPYSSYWMHGADLAGGPAMQTKAPDYWYGTPAAAPVERLARLRCPPAVKRRPAKSIPQTCVVAFRAQRAAGQGAHHREWQTFPSSRWRALRTQSPPTAPVSAEIRLYAPSCSLNLIISRSFFFPSDRCHFEVPSLMPSMSAISR